MRAYCLALVSRTPRLFGLVVIALAALLWIGGPESAVDSTLTPFCATAAAGGVAVIAVDVAWSAWWGRRRRRT